MYKVSKEILTTNTKHFGNDTNAEDFDTDEDFKNTGYYFRKAYPFATTDDDADVDENTDPVNKNENSFQLDENSFRDNRRHISNSGKCSCCPYGYHVNLDFVEQTNEDDLFNLNKLQTSSDMRLQNTLLENYKQKQQMKQHNYSYNNFSKQKNLFDSCSSTMNSANIHNDSKKHTPLASGLDVLNQSANFDTNQSKSFSGNFATNETHTGDFNTISPFGHDPGHGYIRDTNSINEDRLDKMHSLHREQVQHDLVENQFVSMNSSKNNTNHENTHQSLNDGHSNLGQLINLEIVPLSNPRINDFNQSEAVYTNFDGSTTRVIEEHYKTKTTRVIVQPDDHYVKGFQSDPDSDSDISTGQNSPEYNVDEKIEEQFESMKHEQNMNEKYIEKHPRQIQLEELQRKLQQIQPVDSQKNLKTYVNFNVPMEEENRVSTSVKTFVPQVDYSDQVKMFSSHIDHLMVKNDSIIKENINQNQTNYLDDNNKKIWLKEKEELLRIIKELQDENKKIPELKNQINYPDDNNKRILQQEKEEFLRKIKELQDENKKIPELKNQINYLDDNNNRIWQQEKEEFLRKIKELQDENKQIPELKKQYNLIIEDLSKKSAVKDQGVGDSSIDEEDNPDVCRQKLGPNTGSIGDHPSFKLLEREFNTEETTEIREKDIKTIFLTGNDNLSNFHRSNINGINFQSLPKIETSSIGVGDSNVFEDSSYEVHQKELRTIYLGGSATGLEPKQTRNVGILCKAAMRDVGMMHVCEEEKPMIKNQCVGVNEILATESEDSLISHGMGNKESTTDITLRPDGSATPSGLLKEQSYFTAAGFSSATLTRFTGLRGMSEEELIAFLDKNLKRTVRSIACQCQFSNENKSVDATQPINDMKSVGCGDATIDVDVVPKRIMKSIAIDNRPSLFHRCCGTDFIYKLDASTTTNIKSMLTNRAMNTDSKSIFSIGTNTENMHYPDANTITEQAIFFALGELKNSSCNTDDIELINKRVNTEIVGNMDISNDVLGETKTRFDSINDSLLKDNYDNLSGGMYSKTTTKRFIKSTPSVSNTSTLFSTKKNVTFEDNITSKMLGFSTKNDLDVNNDSTKIFHTNLTIDKCAPSYTKRVISETYKGGLKNEDGSYYKSYPGLNYQDIPSENDFKNISTSEVINGNNITRMDVDMSSRTLSHEIDTTGGKRIITETHGPDFTKKVITQNYMSGFQNSDNDTTNFDNGRLSSVDIYSQSMEGPYYTEKTIDKPFGGCGSGGSGYTSIVKSVGSYNPNFLDQSRNNFSIKIIQPGTVEDSYNSEDFVNQTEFLESDSKNYGSLIQKGTMQFDQGGNKTIIKEYQGPGYANKSIVITTKKKILDSSDIISDGSNLKEFHDKIDGSKLQDISGESFSSDNFYDKGSSNVVTKQWMSSTLSKTHDPHVVMQKSKSSSISSKSGGLSSSGTVYNSLRYSPDEAMTIACNTIIESMKQPSNYSTIQLEESYNIIKKKWFVIVGQKEIDSRLVWSFIAYISSLSPLLLENVINMQDENGNTCLHYAVSYGHTDFILQLLETGKINVNSFNKAGFTCIMLASLALRLQASNIDVVRKLFRAADVNLKAIEGSETSLILAVSHGRLDMTKQLLDAGADVNLTDSNNSTALMCACKRGHYEIVKLLLATERCLVDLKNKDNHNALSIAKENGHQFIVTLLESLDKDIHQEK